jgi:hypothetical protein
MKASKTTPTHQQARDAARSHCSGDRCFASRWDSSDRPVRNGTGCGWTWVTGGAGPHRRRGERAPDAGHPRPRPSPSSSWQRWTRWTRSETRRPRPASQPASQPVSARQKARTEHHLVTASGAERQVPGSSRVAGADREGRGQAHGERPVEAGRGCKEAGVATRPARSPEAGAAGAGGGGYGKEEGCRCPSGEGAGCRWDSPESPRTSPWPEQPGQPGQPSVQPARAAGSARQTPRIAGRPGAERRPGRQRRAQTSPRYRW